MTSDYYATLRVRSDIDDASLRRAYRKLMRRYHPDVNVGDDAADQCQAINEAYACLRDPAKRAAYDARRRAHQRHMRTAFSPSPDPYQPVWGNRHSSRFDEETEIEGKGWKAAIIGFAIVMTIVTFAATSAVDRGNARGASDQPITIELKADPARQPATRP